MKEGAWGVLSSRDSVQAHLGMVLGSTSPVDTVSGAWEGRGAGEGAEDLQIGVVGVELASVSMSVGVSGASLPGGGIVRSSVVTFFSSSSVWIC